MDENLDTKNTFTVFILFLFLLSSIFILSLSFSFHLLLCLIFFSPNVTRSFLPSSLAVPSAGTNWRFADVHSCEATTPFEARPRALFVILITKVMSLAALSACAHTPVWTGFICELIYYANYFSECTPRDSRVPCFVPARTSFSCSERFHRRRFVFSPLLLYFPSHAFSCFSLSLCLSFSGFYFFIVPRVFAKKARKNIERGPRTADNWLAWLQSHRANVYWHFCGEFLRALSLPTITLTINGNWLVKNRH